MNNQFSTQEYIRMLGKELVFEFDKAGITTHPHAVGSGRENSARMMNIPVSKSILSGN